MFTVSVTRTCYRLTRQIHSIAIVGSGPSGFYTLKYLLDSEKKKMLDLHIDVFERLPVPYGLVRYGVAPDHPEVKTVATAFHDIMSSSSSNARYFGNVSIGETNPQAHQGITLGIDELRKAYDIVILAYGASDDVKLGLNPHENKVLSSREFVNWYNGHPWYRHVDKKLHLDRVTDVIIVGNGNVALDCARILAKNVDELQGTDIAVDALYCLQHSKVKNITILGRRGHIQASFTIKELRELGSLQHAQVKFRDEDITNGSNPASEEELSQSRPRQRQLDLIKKLASHPTVLDKRTIHLRFLLTPKQVIVNSEGEVGGLVVEENRLEGAPGAQRAVGTGVYETLPCQLIIKSVGYKSVTIGGIPFDDQSATVPNERGRVGAGLYVTGWLKRGPTGIIGSNIVDAKETVAAIVDDIEADKFPPRAKDYDPIHSLPQLNNDQVVTWSKYLKIEEFELNGGRIAVPQKPREKLLSVEEMLHIANNSY